MLFLHLLQKIKKIQINQKKIKQVLKFMSFYDVKRNLKLLNLSLIINMSDMIYVSILIIYI
jgi:hypothetical protein